MVLSEWIVSWKEIGATHKLVDWLLMFFRSLFKMLKMHVQAKLNSFMTNTATEQRNYTAESLLSFRYVV